MTDLLAQGVSMLNTVRKASLSATATYQRGLDEVDVAATVGTYQYEVAAESGALMTAHVSDFIVTAADLLIGDAVIEPMIGDRMVVDGRTHEVLDLVPGECWRWSGPPGTAYRIHTKEITE